MEHNEKLYRCNGYSPWFARFRPNDRNVEPLPATNTNRNQVSIDPPINADRSSVWSSKATVPVQYDVLAGYGPVFFSSYKASGSYSYLDFVPNSALTFDQIANLSAVYTFTDGSCHGGALRWSVSLSTGKSIWIYYGKYPTFADCSSNTADPTINQSGLNMINANFDGTGGDLRYDTSQLSPGTQYNTYANAVTLAGSATVTECDAGSRRRMGW
jgi:hypothetical protein